MTVCTRPKSLLRWVWMPCIIVGLGWLLLPMQSLAATGTIADNADVLDTTAIKQTTDPFSYTVNIFTTKTFAGSNDDFDNQIAALASSYDETNTTTTCDPVKDIGCELYSTTSSPYGSYSVRTDDASTSVEIGINVATRHLAINGGQSVKIADNLYDQAITAFADSMHQTHDNYTQATIAALNTLENSSGRFWGGIGKALPFIIIGIVLVGGFISSMLFGNSGYRRRYYGGGYGGGGGFGGGGGGGGGGASGNF